MKNSLTLFFISILATLVPYLACQFFDSPLLHGFFSAEEFFLLLALTLPYGKILWKLPFFIAIFAYAIYDNSIVGFLPTGVVALQYFYARKILWGANRLEIPHPIAFGMLVAAVSLNFGINQLQNRQPIMEYPVKTWFWQLFTPGIIGQNSYLQEDIKRVFPQWNSATPVIADFSKPTVMILVESYGVNKSVDYDKALFSTYADVNPDFMGLFFRNASHTQGAEWEDFNTLKGFSNRSAVPAKFKANGLQTWYLHGDNGSFYERRANYAKFGFDSLLYREDLEKRNLSKCNYGFSGICDSAIVNYMDSLLADSVPNHPKKQ